MKIINRSNEVATQIQRTGSVIELVRQSGDDDVFNTGKQFSCRDSVGWTAIYGGFTASPKSLGVVLSGGGLTSASFAPTLQFVDPSRFYMNAKMEIKTPVSYISPMTIEIELDTASKFITYTFYDGYFEIDTFSLGSRRLSMTNGDVIVIDLHVARNLSGEIWTDIKVNNEQVKVQLEPEFGVGFSGFVIVGILATVSPSDDGYVIFREMQSMPMLTSDTMVDGSDLRLPLCLSYYDDRAVFLCRPISPSTTATARLYGADWTVGGEVLLDELELILDDERKDQVLIMPSQVEKVYSDETNLLVCPVIGISQDNRTDSNIINRCFDDDTYRLDNLETKIRTIKSGELRDVNNTPEFVMEYGNVRYGKDSDLNQMLLFPDATPSSEFVTQFIPTGEVAQRELEYRTVRSLSLSNDKILYYGLMAEKPLLGVELFEVEIVLSNINYKRIKLDSVIESSGTNLFVDVYRLGQNDNPIASTGSVAAPYTNTITLLLAHGSYKVRLTPVGFAGGLSAFYGTITITQRNPNGTVVQTLSQNIVPKSQRIFDTEMNIHFDVNTKEGKLFWMLYDPSTSTIERNTLTESSYDYRAEVHSVSCLDIGDSFVLLYCEYNDAEPRIMYRRYDYDGLFMYEGFIEVSDPSALISGIKCFDAVEINGIYYFYLNFKRTSPISRGNRVAWLDSEFISNRPIQSDSLPYQDPYIFVSRHTSSSMKFELTEVIDQFVTAIELKSLNNQYPAFKTEGISDTKGNRLDAQEYIARPNYKTGPAIIRANQNKDANIVIVSTVDTRYRQPLIMAGLDSYREVAVPEFFDVTSAFKSLTTPIDSIDACLYNDGRVYATATTTNQPDLTPIVNTPVYPLNANRPLCELAIIPTDILNSPTTVYLQIAVNESWYNWYNTKAYQSSERQIVIPILNQYDRVRTYDAERDIGSGFGIQNGWESQRYPAGPYINSISIRNERGMLIYGVARAEIDTPDIYYSHRADRLPFKLPLEEQLIASHVVLDNTLTRFPGQIQVIDGDPILTPQRNHIKINGADNSVVRVTYDYEPTSLLDLSTLNRSFALGRGSRFKITIDLSEIGADGINIDVLDTYADPNEAANPLTSTYAGGSLHIYLQGGQIRARHYYNDGGEQTVSIMTLSTTSGTVFDIHGIIKRLTDELAESSFIIKPNRLISGSKDGTSERYGDRIVDEVYSSTTSRCPTLTVSADPQRYVQIYNYLNTAQSDNYKIYGIGCGVLSHEESVSYDWINNGVSPPYNPTYTTIQKSGCTPFVISDSAIAYESSERTSYGFPIKASLFGRTQPVYWNDGYEWKPEGSTTKVGDVWSLQRDEINSVDSIKSSNVHGKWLSVSDNSVVRLWADAEDSDRDKFNINRLIVTGANFRYFYIIGRDNVEGLWSVLKVVDLASQAYNQLTVNLNPIDSNKYTLTSPTDQIKPVYGPEYGFIDYNKPALITKLEDDFIAIKTTEVYNESETGINLIDGAICIEIEASYKQIGIQIPSQKTYEGYYTLSSLDFGWASRLGVEGDVTDNSGKSIKYDINIGIGHDNSTQDYSYKNANTDILIDYTATDIRSVTRIRSITEKVSKNHKPVWFIGANARDPNLCFISSSPSYSVLIDDGEKIYKTTLNLKRVK